MGTEISGIAKSMLQVKTGRMPGVSEKETEQDVTVSFMDLMQKSSLSDFGASARWNSPGVSTDVKSVANAAYDSNTAQIKSVSVKEQSSTSELQPEDAKALEAYEEEIRRILKDEFGVTDEEITNALLGLGMQLTDVSNMKDLAALVQALTGEDLGSLFLSEGFQNVMQQVAAVTEALCAELGITEEELNQIFEAWEQKNQVDSVESSDQQTETKPEQAESEKAPVAEEKTEAVRTEAVSQEYAKTVDASEPEEDAASMQKSRKNPEETRPLMQSGKDASEMTDADSGESNFMEHAKGSGPEPDHTGVVFSEQSDVKTESFVSTQEAVQPHASAADAMELIEQIAKNVRVTISAAETSMEMQLNPENLGKIYLHISEREGAIRAQITAQNEVVKEALETHLVELRQSLNQQGMKVDAIEVTVGTHEFEQNLEQNARQEEQMHQQMEESKKRGRKNLNLNDLDSLSGLMSEEEQLAAQIMRDNGNQVDLTA